MRGKAVSFPNILTRCRITPAYAGKRYAGCDFGNVQRDHPRLCGEKLLSIFQKSNHLGSPPPMRGKGNWTRRSTTSMRITPAYAGKSLWFRDIFSCNKDHPRLCGEKCCRCCGYGTGTGSPPPMRGKGIIDISIIMIHRITPAYAGKRRFLSCVTTIFWDHPRLCGEKLVLCSIFFRNLGSPPPMRGKAAGLSVSPARTGITPAYAGKRTVSSTAAACSWDHPRLCGEKSRLWYNPW